MPPPASRRFSPFALPIFLAVALLWAVVAYLASRGNSSTFDEPLHTAAAVLAINGDLTPNPEHPPLWKYLAGLTVTADLPLDRSPEALARLRQDPVAQWPWAVAALYHADPPRGEEAVRQARRSMVALGFVLLVAAARFAARLAGPDLGRARLAALLAFGLLALDPLLIAHAPIVTNDVAVSLFLLLTVWSAWELRRGAHWAWGLALGLALAAALTTKFTGVVALPLAAGLLLLRRRPRWVPLLIALPVMYAGIWAAYGFRYAPGPSPALIDTQATAARVSQMRLLAAGQDPRTTPLPAPDFPTRTLLALERTRLLPQPLTAGLLMSYGVTRSNPAFAAGHYSPTGFWWYFPFALLVKTPLALLALWGLGLLSRPKLQTPTTKSQTSSKDQTEENPQTPAIPNPQSAIPNPQSEAPPSDIRHPTSDIATVTLILALITLASPLNIGLRHALPATVLLSVLAAVALSHRMQLKKTRRAVAALFALLAVETLSAFPHYIAFFNLPARLIGPEKLLADSNLDWGQDLARLADWRAAHPDGTLYLAYWGTPDPAALGLAATHLPNTYEFSTTPSAPPSPLTSPGYIAVSTTYLQGLTTAGTPAPFYARLLTRPPDARIGQSILVWRFPN